MFKWRNREACLRRVVVTMQCLNWDVIKAVNEALDQGVERGYCYFPDLIPDKELQRLKLNAEAYFEDRAFQYVDSIPLERIHSQRKDGEYVLGRN